MAIQRNLIFSSTGGDDTQPSGTAVGEREGHAQQHDHADDDEPAALFHARQEDVGEGEDEIDGQGRTVGRVVVVEWRHHPVGRVAVETILGMVDDGVDAHDAQGSDVKPNELMDVFGILEEDGAKEEGRHHKPQPRHDELDGHQGHLARDGGDHHPGEHAVDDDGDGMPRDAPVVFAVVEHFGHKQNQDAHQQGLGGQ